MATQAPGHGAATDRQGRLTLTSIDDKTQVTTSTTTTSPLTQVSRLESADIDNTTKVDEVVEVGTNGLVGGVVQLGSFKSKMTHQATSTKLLGLVTSKKQNATAGVQTSWNYFDLSSSLVDYTRQIADGSGFIYAGWVALDAVVTKAMYSAKGQGMTMEEFEFMGPHLAFYNGYPVSKNYVVQSADITAGSVPVSSTFFGALNTATAGAEIPVRNRPPVVGQVQNALYSSGRINFFKVLRSPSAAATINGISYSANTLVRYRENQDYIVTAASLGTIGAQAAVTTAIPGYGNITAPEFIVGSSIVVDPGATNAETATVTAVGVNTVSFTTTKTHPTTGCAIALSPVSGRVVYNTLNGSLTFGDTLLATDLIRVFFSSYDTSSSPKTISTTSLDTTDAAGIPGRLTPVSIMGSGLPRVQSATITVNVPRKEVQGNGEDEVIYGTSGVPGIDYSLDVYPIDNTLMELLTAGATGNGTLGDIYSVDYIARYMNNNALPFAIIVKSPLVNSKELFRITGNQPVFTSQGESGGANAELSHKFSGKDYKGAFTITATS
jgi:hypothetical protein